MGSIREHRWRHSTDSLVSEYNLIEKQACAPGPGGREHLGLLSVLLLLDEDPESLLLAQLDALADHKGELRHYPTESAQRWVDEPNQQGKKEKKENRTF